MEDVKMESTADYGIFKILDFNRDRERSHIDKVKETLRNENYLHLHPIIVNKDYEVIDGQHRLAAAQELKLPVYYIRASVGYNHVISANQVQRKSSLQDVLKFYSVKDKNENYSKLQKLLLRINVQPKALFGLIFGSATNSMIELVKEGKFKYPADPRLVDELCDAYLTFFTFILERKLKPFNIYKGAPFMIGFRNLVLADGFELSMFMNKLSNRWHLLKHQANAKQWYELLAGIYNWKNAVSKISSEIDIEQ